MHLRIPHAPRLLHPRASPTPRAQAPDAPRIGLQDQKFDARGMRDDLAFRRHPAGEVEHQSADRLDIRVALVLGEHMADARLEFLHGQQRIQIQRAIRRVRPASAPRSRHARRKYRRRSSPPDPRWSPARRSRHIRPPRAPDACASGAFAAAGRARRSAAPPSAACAGFSRSRNASARPAKANTSLMCTMPSTSSRCSRNTGIREWPSRRICSIACASVTSARMAMMSGARHHHVIGGDLAQPQDVGDQRAFLQVKPPASPAVPMRAPRLRPPAPARRSIRARDCSLLRSRLNRRLSAELIGFSRDWPRQAVRATAPPRSPSGVHRRHGGGRSRADAARRGPADASDAPPWSFVRLRRFPETTPKASRISGGCS